MVLRGPARDVVGKVVSALKVGEVFWNRRYAAAEHAVDEAIVMDLQAADVAVRTFSGILVHEPHEVLTQERWILPRLRTVLESRRRTSRQYA